MAERRFAGILALCLAGLLLSACGNPDGRHQDRRLKLSGSSTVAPLAAATGKRFESGNPNLRVDVQAGGSSRGIADAKRGLVDIGTASRALTAAERETLAAHTIAIDGIALIVHRDNPVSGLSADQVRAIYTGDVSDWAELDQPAGPITVVNKAEGRATRVVFLDHFGLDGTAIEATLVAGSNQQAIRSVAGNRGAIGYVSIGTATHEASQGTAIRLPALDGIAPTLAAVRSGRYPVQRPLNLVVRDDNDDPLVARFVAYARSDAVTDLVRGLHYVPAR